MNIRTYFISPLESLSPLKLILSCDLFVRQDGGFVMIGQIACQSSSLEQSITKITNHQLLTIKTIKNGFLYCVLGHVPLGFIGFNKPPIEGDQSPEETHMVHTVPLKPVQFPL